MNTIKNLFRDRYESPELTVMELQLEGSVLFESGQTGGIMDDATVEPI